MQIHSQPPKATKEEMCPGARLGTRQRLKHFTWAWFLSTMSTGGLAIALAETPHQFRGLYTIGLIVLLFNITLFVTLAICMLTRAYFYPSHFLKSFTNPTESFFIGSFWLSISVIIGGVQLYGITHGPGWSWLIDAVNVLYWVYAGASLVNSVLQYWVLMSGSMVRPVPLTPSMFLAGYSAMLTGTIASLVAGSQPPARAMAVIVSGCAFQGFGWTISLFCINVFMSKLLENGLPPPQFRPTLFIPVGSSAYTIVAIIGQANALPAGYGYFARHSSAIETLQVVALFTSIFLWIVSFWFFAIAVLANATAVVRMTFSLTWWAFIFPNVGFTLSTIIIGKELRSEAILWVGSALTIGLVLIWLITAVACVRALYLGKILWPGADEDKTT